MCTHTQQGKQICWDDNLKIRHQSGTAEKRGGRHRDGVAVRVRGEAGVSAGQVSTKWKIHWTKDKRKLCKNKHSGKVCRQKRQSKMCDKNAARTSCQPPPAPSLSLPPFYQFLSLSLSFAVFKVIIHKPRTCRRRLEWLKTKFCVWQTMPARWKTQQLLLLIPPPPLHTTFCCWQVGNPSVNIFLFLLRSKFAKFVACFLGDNETRIKHFTCVCQRLRPLGSCLSTHSVSLTLSLSLSLPLSVADFA